MRRIKYVICFFFILIFFTGCSQSIEQAMNESNVEFKQIHELKKFNNISIILYETMEPNKFGIGFIEKNFNEWNLLSNGGFIYFDEDVNTTWHYSFRKIKNQSYPILYGSIYDESIDKLVVKIVDNENEIVGMYKTIEIKSIDVKRKLWYMILEKQLIGDEKIEIIGYSENGETIYPVKK